MKVVVSRQRVLARRPVLSVGSSLAVGSPPHVASSPSVPRPLSRLVHRVSPSVARRYAPSLSTVLFVVALESEKEVGEEE